jgi:hypothetical protein
VTKVQADYNCWYFVTDNMSGGSITGLRAFAERYVLVRNHSRGCATLQRRRCFRAFSGPHADLQGEAAVPESLICDRRLAHVALLVAPAAVLLAFPEASSAIGYETFQYGFFVSERGWTVDVGHRECRAWCTDNNGAGLYRKGYVTAAINV